MTANKATRKSCGYVDGANRLHHRKTLQPGDFEHPGGAGKKMEALDLQGLPGGGLYWTRTSDPIDVNDVLYQLSHATVYINYDGYATYSMTFKPKAKAGLMPAAKNFLPKIQRIC